MKIYEESTTKLSDSFIHKQKCYYSKSYLVYDANLIKTKNFIKHIIREYHKEHQHGDTYYYKIYSIYQIKVLKNHT